MRLSRPGEQFREVVVDAGHTKVRLTLEGLTEVVGAMVIFIDEFDNGENEVVGVVERVEDFFLGHRDR